MKYEKVSTNLNFVEREKKIESFWKENNIFQKTIDSREKGETFTFFDGPPTANGKPHIGHVLTRVIKDMIPRYRTMKGYHVLRKAGWDTHGLPVELEVEKLLGLDGKEQIEKYGVEPFIAKCKESVWKYKGMWEKFSDTVGYWADMDNPYITYDNNYIESEWWSLKQIWNKGLLYKGFKIVPYCPRCGTALASHEVAQGYKDVKEKSAIAKFRIKNETNKYFLAWTTTPWTLPSNVALCVNKNVEYSEVEYNDGSVYILATSLLDSVLGEGTYTVINTYLGNDLEYREYEPLFYFKELDKKAYFVTCDDYVTVEDGTGIVHIAPAFGEDDNRVGKKYDLPFLQLVDTRGVMTIETPWAGTFCKDADKLVFQALAEKGLLFKSLPFEHSYPHCWRCDSPLIYYARDTWFIKMTAVRDDLVRNNKKVNWIPESIGTGRFGDWINNVQDWGLSRDRYWGTPLNIWECTCGNKHSIGSISELKSMSDNCPDNIELHKPFIDSVTIKCPKCGKDMHRVKEVIDCWYDSGAMPFAQYHYPFENEDIFKDNFPADFISEAIDQTRGWFYSLLAISTLIFDETAYKNVIVLGHVQDENGQKMSKSKGNAVDPFDALSEFGADAIRWYFYSNSAPWLPNRFSKAAVIEGQRKFLGTLWNTYAFYVLYSNIDEFDPSEYSLDYSKLSVMDKWILSKLNSLIKDVDNLLNDYKIQETSRVLEEFIDQLSNWYVRRSRERFWEKGMPQDKINAYMTLYTCLDVFSKLSAPMIPFMTETIYQNITKRVYKDAPESIHLCDFPVADESLIDFDLEEKMNQVLSIVVLGRNCRNSSNIKNRQPIAGIYIKSADKPLPDFYIDIVKDELNSKSVEFISDSDKFISFSFKPQLRTLGRRFGKDLNTVKEILLSLDGNSAMHELESTGCISIVVNGKNETLSRDDLLIDSKQLEGFEGATEGALTVVLNTNLTSELIEEGFVREIVSKIQTMRKESGFEVMDNITVYFKADPDITAIVKKNALSISEDVLAKDISFDDVKDFSKEWDINGKKVSIGVEKI